MCSKQRCKGILNPVSCSVLLAMMRKRACWRSDYALKWVIPGAVGKQLLSQFDSSAHNLPLRLRIFTSPSSGPPNIRLALRTFSRSSEDSTSFSVRNSKTSFAAFLNSITFRISTQFHFQHSSPGPPAVYHCKCDGRFSWAGWPPSESWDAGHPGCKVLRWARFLGWARNVNGLRRVLSSCCCLLAPGSARRLVTFQSRSGLFPNDLVHP